MACSILPLRLGGIFICGGSFHCRLIPTQMEERSFRTKPRLNLSRRGCSEVKVGCCDIRKFSHDRKRVLDTPGKLPVLSTGRPLRQTEPSERAKRKGLGGLRSRICNPSARSSPSGARYSAPEITATAQAAAETTNAARQSSSISYSTKTVPAQIQAKQINPATFFVRVWFEHLLNIW